MRGHEGHEVSLVLLSSPFLMTSIFRHQPMAPPLVCVVLVTSKNFSGMGNDSSLGTCSLTLGSS